MVHDIFDAMVIMADKNFPESTIEDDQFVRPLGRGSFPFYGKPMLVLVTAYITIPLSPSFIQCVCP